MSYIDSFSMDYERQASTSRRDLSNDLSKDVSKDVSILSSSFRPNFNSTELSLASSDGKSVAAEEDSDLLICGTCKRLFTSLPMFQKHKKSGCRRKNSCNRCNSQS